MNNRSLTRGDLGVGLAAALLFICSFLDLYTVDVEGFGSSSENGWSADFFPVLPSFFLAGVIGGGLIVGSRFLPQPERLFAGLRLDQWGIALTVTSAWAGLWTLLGGPENLDSGVGLILGVLAALALTGLAVATPLVPSLKLPLSSGNSRQPGVGGQPYGGQPGYGYPAAGGMQQPVYGVQPGQPGMQPAASGQPGADPGFQPFWFAVPASRPLYGEDGSRTPVAELAPGTWYLAVEQRGQALVAQTQDGRRGVLQDTSGIQRG